MDTIYNELNNFLFESINNDNRMLSNFKQALYQDIVRKRQQHISWHCLHSFSVFYPVEPSETQRMNTIEIIKKIKSRLLFCSACSKNTNDIFVEEYDLNKAVSTKNELIHFFIKYHSFINKNFVNSSYDDSFYTIENIIDKYNNTDYRQFIKTRYNIDLNIFMNDSLIDSSNIDYFNDRLKIMFDNANLKIYQEIKNLDFSISIALNK